MTEQQAFEEIERIICQRSALTKEELDLTSEDRLVDRLGGDNAYSLVVLCTVKFGKSIVTNVRTVTAGGLARLIAG